jgi:hypothetical protein
MKLECLGCGFIVRIPMCCDICGARNGMKGEMPDEPQAYGPGDFAYVQETVIEYEAVEVDE